MKNSYLSQTSSSESNARKYVRGKQAAKIKRNALWAGLALFMLLLAVGKREVAKEPVRYVLPALPVSQNSLSF